MATRLREEFRLRCLALNHPDYSSFANSKWMSRPWYLVYRWVLAVFVTISILLARIYFGSWYTSFFTDWGFATITIYFDLSAVLCSYQLYKSRHHRSRDITMATDNNNRELQVEHIRDKDAMHAGIAWGYKAMWMLFNIAAVNSMIVTIGYWALLHKSNRRLVGWAGYFNINGHLLNAVLMLLDAAVCPLPVRILHVVYSNVYAVLYITATIIHWLVSGRTAKFYSFLDYSNSPGVAVATVGIGCFIIQPLLQMFFYGIYRFRDWVQAKRSRDDLAKDTGTDLAI